MFCRENHAIIKRTAESGILIQKLSTRNRREPQGWLHMWAYLEVISKLVQHVNGDWFWTDKKWSSHSCCWCSWTMWWLWWALVIIDCHIFSLLRFPSYLRREWLQTSICWHKVTTDATSCQTIPEQEKNVYFSKLNSWAPSNHVKQKPAFTFANLQVCETNHTFSDSLEDFPAILPSLSRPYPWSI